MSSLYSYMPKHSCCVWMQITSLKEILTKMWIHPNAWSPEGTMVLSLLMPYMKGSLPDGLSQGIPTKLDLVWDAERDEKVRICLEASLLNSHPHAWRLFPVNLWGFFLFIVNIQLFCKKDIIKINKMVNWRYSGSIQVGNSGKFTGVFLIVINL